MFTAESWVLGKVSQNEIFKMAVHLSDENGAILHLSDVEKNSKELNERGKDALKPPTAASKIEILCKTLAFLIVLCLFCVHLARVLREGTVPACYFIRFSVNQTLLLVYTIIKFFFFILSCGIAIFWTSLFIVLDTCRSRSKIDNCPKTQLSLCMRLSVRLLTCNDCSKYLEKRWLKNISQFFKKMFLRNVVSIDICLVSNTTLTCT